MESYKELRAKAQELMKQAEAARRAEIATVVADIQVKMKEYGITVDDLKGAKKGKGKPVAAKYYDSATGQSWSGRGRSPKWLVDAEAKGSSRDAFLVK
jgi:DNA-binding protein H-NS